MKVLMIGGLASAVAVVAGALGLPSEMHVERTAVVHGTASQVHAQVAQLENRPGWVVWTVQDPEAVYTFDGRAGEPGSTMSWVGEEIGTATLTLVDASTVGEVVARLQYEAPFEMTTTDRFRIVDLGDGTSEVTWSAEAELAFGPDRIFGLFADGMIGPDYEDGLARLDALLSNH